VNLVECWFSIAERQATHRGTHTSVRDLNAQLRTYIDGWNDRAHPFTRSKTRPDPRQGQPSEDLDRGALAG
jgi:hypothetical protein